MKFFQKYIKSIKSSIITGIVIVIPSFTTVYLFFKLFIVVDSFLPNFFHSLFPEIPEKFFPGVGFLIFLFIASFIGFAAKNYFGKKILHLNNQLFSKIPLLNKVYLGIKQVLDSIISNKKRIFERPVLVEYPKEGSYCIGFVTSQTKGEVAHKLAEELYSIFIPTTPNPTSGFLLYLPVSKVIELEMSIETALKIVMSAGVVSADDYSRPSPPPQEEVKKKTWK